MTNGQGRGPRIYHPEPIGDRETLKLTSEASRHLVRVLRLRLGDPVTLFDGLGGEYRARIDTLDNTRAVGVHIEGHDAIERESGLTLTLAQVIARGERMDLIVQKAVELGVSRIEPLTSERCNVRLDARRAQKRLEHWHGIVIAACEQCGRNRLPMIDPVARFEDWIAGLPRDDRVLCLTPTAAVGLGEWCRTHYRAGDALTLLIGPEGGFAPAEIEQGYGHSLFPVRLGSRTLRTETAGLATIAALQALCGDLG